MFAKLRARLGSRAFFILTHTLVALAIFLVLLVLIYFTPPYVPAAVGAGFSLLWKEIGELAAKAKEMRGKFKNSAGDNLALFKRAFSNSWVRRQWLIPLLILLLVGGLVSKFVTF